ncbi:MAG: ankyrin repeat domain-containing protein [Bryobacteraceae bacterium]
MTQNIPTRAMRENPDLEQLKRQAKELLHATLTAEPGSKLALHDALLEIARSYGFASWPKLKAYVDGVTVRRLADAVSAGDLVQVQAMLKARPELADMAMSYGDERRPIHFAVMNRQPAMVRLLMQRGADARAGIYPHRDATKAWTLARDREYTEIVALIEEEEQRRSPVESEGKDEVVGDEEAREAVAAGDIEWLRTRHATGTFSNPIRWDGGGLLTVAVRHDRLAVLRLLLDFGFHPDEKVASGEGDWVAYSQGYPLWHAAALGKKELAELLLARGADPNVHVDSSGSSVYSAYSHRQWEMVELLRRHGGIVTADTAAIYRQTDLARQILNSDNSQAAELLRFGASGGDPEIVRMALGQIDWPNNDPRWFGILTEPLYFWHHIPWLYAGNKEFDRGTYLPCFRLILERCGPNLVGGFGRTALHEVAAMRDHITEQEAVEFARALLDAGAAVDVRDDILKSTPLGWACRWGRAGVVDLLLKRGADPVEADADSWARPLAWAEKFARAPIVHRLRGA